MTSANLVDRAARLLPGGVNSPVRSLRHVNFEPIFFSRAEGPYLYDMVGNAYIDFCLSFGPHLLGHSPRSVVGAIREQAARAVSFGACHAGEVDFAELILRSYPFLQKVRLVNSGTEAVMTALRVARGHTGRPKILKFEGCYHGHSDSLLAKAGSGVAELSEATSRGVVPSLVEDTVIARLDDPKAIEAAFDEWGSELAAVIVEPVPANHGLYVPHPSQLESLVSTARKHGALVIFDEVITGFRLGASGASGLYDLQPDIVTLGKIIGGGLPLAAVAGREAILSELAPLGQVYQAGTLSGNPLGCAAGIAVLTEIYRDPPYARLADLTAGFARELEAALRPLGDWRVSQLGSIFWLHLGEAVGFPPELGPAQKEAYATLFQRAVKEGIYLPPSPYEVGFLSTAHTPEVLESALERLARCAK